MRDTTHDEHKLVAVVERMPMVYPIRTVQLADGSNDVVTYGNEDEGYAFIDQLPNGYPEPDGWCETCGHRAELPPNFEGISNPESILDTLDGQGRH